MTREKFASTYKETIFTGEWTGYRHRYGYKNRSFDLGHQPTGFIIGAVDAEYRDKELGVRHGYIEYPFELTYLEIYNFELIDMGVV